MPTLWPPRATFENVRPGDTFPILIKFVPPSLSQASDSLNPQSLIAVYVSELLQKGLPSQKVKASLAAEVQLIGQFTTQDILTLTGTITAKDPQQKSVAYTIEVATQENQIVARAQGQVTF
ncbi:MAG: hypothetical protein FJ320_04070 [SAR202 cluster bacterium]|nr:hypothetical protein [SAR202 cluster bacterium]